MQCLYLKLKMAKRWWGISSHQRADGEIPPALCMVKMPSAAGANRPSQGVYRHPGDAK